MAKNHEIAEKYFSDEEKREDLIFVEEFNIFYMWHDGYYKKIEDEDLARDIWNFLRYSFSDKNITTSLVKDIMQQIKWGCLRRVKHLDTQYYAFKDKLLNLDTFETEAFDKEKIAIYSFPFDYDDTEMETPVFDNFLRTSLVTQVDTFKADEDLIHLMQESLGFLLLDNLKAETAIFFTGKGANGKSVMANLIQDIFGEEFCSAMSIENMTTSRFKTNGLIGKKVNIANEEESKFVNSSLFKALVTGESIDAEWKFGGSFSFKPRTKHVFCTNDIPTFKGVNFGLIRRIMILPFYRQFSPKDKDHLLNEKMRLEIPGIVKFALEGAKRLVKNNYVFTKCEASSGEHDNFVDELSSAIRFVRNEYMISEDMWKAKVNLYYEFKTWCLDNGKKPMNQFQFNKDVADNILGIREKVKKVEGHSNRCFNLEKRPAELKGVALVPPTPPTVPSEQKSMEDIIF